MNFVNQIITGDAFAILQGLPDGIVQMCVTSPPYYGLRDYGTGKWVDGNPGCDHEAAIEAWLYRNFAQSAGLNVGIRTQMSAGRAQLKACPGCGATKEDNQIGLEETPEAYIDRLVAVFREVWRVLRDDGTLWVNIGDSYSDSTIGRKDAHRTIDGKPVSEKLKSHPAPRDRTNRALGPKQLLGIPWRLAFALQADGWILRSDIIWHKPAAMPESVTDRPTSAHEHIFLLAKQERYFYDAEAIKEKASPNTHSRGRGMHPKTAAAGSGIKANSSFESAIREVVPYRNKRNVWMVASQPYPESHFATFPPKLIEPCILAGSRSGDIVFDPFMGAGTTALVALQHGRSFLGIELNPEYVKLAEKRIATVQQHLWTTTGGAA